MKGIIHVLSFWVNKGKVPFGYLHNNTQDTIVKKKFDLFSSNGNKGKGESLLIIDYHFNHFEMDSENKGTYVLILLTLQVCYHRSNRFGLARSIRTFCKAWTRANALNRFRHRFGQKILYPMLAKSGINRRTQKTFNRTRLGGRGRARDSALIPYYNNPPT